MIAWARADRIKAEVADVTDEWLTEFRLTHLGDIRKLGVNRNARTLYRSEAVLKALEGVADVAKKALVAALILFGSAKAEARACSTVWTAPKVSATRCEHCDRLRRAGKILKGGHLREWRVIWLRHIENCPVWARCHR